MNLIGIFSENVFTHRMIRERTSRAIYRRVEHCLKKGLPIGDALSQMIASALKDWAIERGAIRYMHRFVPVAGCAAQQQRAFLQLDVKRNAITHLSGKSLWHDTTRIMMRMTHEDIPGCVAWDGRSSFFIQGNTLIIPSTFTADSGEAMDVKTPLIRAEEEFRRQSLRVLRLLGHRHVESVSLKICATVSFSYADTFPAAPVQDLNYVDRVDACLKDMDMELWRLGIETQREAFEGDGKMRYRINFVGYGSHAVIDHLQSVLELLQDTAIRQDVICTVDKPGGNPVSRVQWAPWADGVWNLLGAQQAQVGAVFHAALIAALRSCAPILHSQSVEIPAQYLEKVQRDMSKKRSSRHKLQEQHDEQDYAIDFGMSTVPLPIPMGDMLMILSAAVAQCLGDIARKFEDLAGERLAQHVLQMVQDTQGVPSAQHHSQSYPFYRYAQPGSQYTQLLERNRVCTTQEIQRYYTVRMRDMLGMLLQQANALGIFIRCDALPALMSYCAELCEQLGTLATQNIHDPPQRELFDRLAGLTQQLLEGVRSLPRADESYTQEIQSADIIRVQEQIEYLTALLHEARMWMARDFWPEGTWLSYLHEASIPFA